MILTVASYKGGVGKTTTAVHLAEYLERHHGRTLLLDGDSTRNATNWMSRRAEADGSFPVTVAPIEASARLSRDFEHIVIDTGQKPTDDDLHALALNCDLLVVPSVPSFLETDGLAQTIGALNALAARNYRVLLTRVDHFAGGRAAELRRELADKGVPLFAGEIPRLTAFEKAVGAGQIVGEVNDPQAARAWSCYEAVGRELSLQLARELGREAAR